MSDTETIAAAYADAIKALYKVMMSSYATADGNKATEKQADDSFRAGIELARKVRDRAVALSK